MRLDKFLANSGFGTRKEVKKLIKDKQIVVNEEMALKSQQKIDEENDIVRVMGMVVKYQPYVYIMMNKPAGYICANEDKYNECVVDLLDEYNHLDLFSIGRLDKDTTGLLLITNDGKFAHNITSPKKAIKKVYTALISGIINKDHILEFEKGIIIDNDYKCLPALLEIIEYQDDYTLANICIQEGKFHQVKKMVQALGMEVLNLKRIKIKDLELDKSLELFEYRELSEDEIQSLK